MLYKPSSAFRETLNRLSNTKWLVPAFFEGRFVGKEVGLRTYKLFSKKLLDYNKLKKNYKKIKRKFKHIDDLTKAPGITFRPI